MPRYDQRCLSCGWEDEITVSSGVHPPCPRCDGQTDRVWRKASNVASDECDFTVEHGFKTPRRFRSRSEWRRAMNEAGIRPYDKFTPIAGTDKPRVGGITRSHPPMDPDHLAWLANAMATGRAQKEPELPKLNIRTDVRELTAREYEAVRGGGHV
jgi:predicted RNA-binding Zn-ribbon protein involved in translation (DUF1610 family)